MPQYQYTSWAAATAVSMLIHLSAAYYVDHYTDFSQSTVDNDKPVVISFELKQSQPAPVPPPVIETEAIEKPAPVVKAQPEPVIEQVQPNPKPKQARQKKRQPAPQQHKQPTTVQQEEVPDQPIIEEPSAEPVKQITNILIESRRLATIREQYIASVLRHIDAHKYYPRKARRRGYEGIVKLNLVIDKQGNVARLTTNHENRLLRDTARKVVNKSKPLPQPPAEIELPLMIEFGMEFRLAPP